MPHCFNPRAHAGRDLTLARHNGTIAVSIHAPMRGATLNCLSMAEKQKFQSTRPCGARLSRTGSVQIVIFVSIHAPMRGATGGIVNAFHVFLVSIHAPMRGATVVGTAKHSCSLFQSTRPCGARHPHDQRQSSHKSFNPRAHAGRDA